jgi:hypothetical protein
MSSQWSGEMLDDPAMMEAFTAQLRGLFRDNADFVAKMRRDAEAMWKANPPAEYGTFEAWWKHRRMTGPFAEIQACLERAAALTFQLEARSRRIRHEIPAERQAAIEAKRTPALQAAAAQPRPAARQARTATDADEDFMSMVRRGRTA